MSVALRANHSLSIDFYLLVHEGGCALDDLYAYSCSFPDLFSGNGFAESKFCDGSITVLGEVEDKPSIVPSHLLLSGLELIAACGFHHHVHLCYYAILTIFLVKYSSFLDKYSSFWNIILIWRTSVCLAATLFLKINSYFR